MKTKIFLVTLVLSIGSIFSNVNAQDRLVVNTILNGSDRVQEFDLSDFKNIKFEESASGWLIFVAIDKVRYRYNLDEFKSISFKDKGPGQGVEKVFSTVKAYPNPVLSYLTVNNVPIGSKVAVYEAASGRQVRTMEAMYDNVQIDFSNLPKGIYILKVGNQEGIRILKR